MNARKPEWVLKDMGRNGRWWIAHVGAFVLSVAADVGQHRHHKEYWWRVKLGANIVLDGDSPDVESAKTVSVAKVRGLADDVLSAL